MAEKRGASNPGKDPARDIKGAENCAVCGKKLSAGDKLHLNAYSHYLSDGVPCPECESKMLHLLSEQELWIDAESFRQAMGGACDWKRKYSISTERAKLLFALRDERSAEVLREHKTEGGSVFAVDQCFQITPHPPIFILRARKVRNKAVVQGLCIKGTFKKGGRVALMQNGVLTEAEILDAISYATARKSEGFTKATFYDELSTNVHKHTVNECDEGWLVLGIEADKLLPEGAFVVGKP